MNRFLLALTLLASGTALAEPTATVRQTSATYVVALPAGAGVFDDVGHRLVRTDGAIDGLRLNMIPADGLAARLGLQDGDIIRSIDNRPVADLGEALAALRKASAAGRLFLHIERDGHRRALTVMIERTAAPAPESAPTSATPAPDETPQATVDWIRPTGPDSFSIHRPGLDGMLGDPGLLARSARMVPAREGDAFVGFKVFGIRSGSVPAALGLKNGDLLRTVNGLPLTNPQQALEAYTRLRKASAVMLELTRRGEPLTLRYTIDDDVVAPPPPAP